MYILRLINSLLESRVYQFSRINMNSHKQFNSKTYEKNRVYKQSNSFLFQGTILPSKHLVTCLPN